MASTEEKTILQGILEFAAGTAATLGVEAAVKALKQQVGTAATAKAKELFVDAGDRTKILAEVAKMVNSNDEGTEIAGRNIKHWVIDAWKDKNEEGELTSLLRKVSDADRPGVFLMLGCSSSYQEFTDTVRAFLAHDNILQLALKIAKQAESEGRAIGGNDFRKIRDFVATSLGNANSTINTLAAAARPGIRNLTETLRRIR